MEFGNALYCKSLTVKTSKPEVAWTLKLCDFHCVDIQNKQWIRKTMIMLKPAENS